MQSPHQGGELEFCSAQWFFGMCLASNTKGSEFESCWNYKQILDWLTQFLNKFKKRYSLILIFT